MSTLFSYFTVRHAAELRLPFLQDLMRVVSAEETQNSRDYVRENLNAMAVKLGQMQAQLLRLDSLGERLATVSGIKLQDARTPPPDRDGRGGPLVNASSLSANELQQALEALSRQLEARTDTLTLLEAQLFEDRVRKARLADDPCLSMRNGMPRPTAGASTPSPASVPCTRASTFRPKSALPSSPRLPAS